MVHVLCEALVSKVSSLTKNDFIVFVVSNTLLMNF